MYSALRRRQGAVLLACLGLASCNDLEPTGPPQTETPQFFLHDTRPPNCPANCLADDVTAGWELSETTSGDWYYEVVDPATPTSRGDVVNASYRRIHLPSGTAYGPQPPQTWFRGGPYTPDRRVVIQGRNIDGSFVYFTFTSYAPLPVIEVTDFERPPLLTCVPGNWCTQPFRIRINLAGSGWYGGDDTRVYVESPSGGRWNQTYASVTVDGTSVEFNFSRLFYPAAGSRIVLVYHPWGGYSAQDTSSVYLPFDQAGAELTLTASPALVDSAGTEVTFTASADGASVLHVVSWEWMPEDATIASATSACAVGENPCVTRVYESGRMVVTARVDGTTEESQAAVHVADHCELFEQTPTDVILADSAVQRILIELAGASNWEDPSIKNRIEVGGYIFVRDGAIQFAPWGYAHPVGPCENAFVADLSLLADPRVTILAEVHTHPASSGTVDYTASDSCVQFLDIGGIRFPATFIGQWAYGAGPSAKDLADWASNDPPSWPGYAMDPDGIWGWEAADEPGGSPVITSWPLAKGGTACIR